MILRGGSVIRIVVATALLLLLPLVAMQVSDEVAAGVVGVWGVNAFFVALWVGSALLFLRARARLDVESTA